MGGAQNTRAELRAASFKGLLRFWFRTLRFDCMQEARIFGSTSEFKDSAGQPAGQSLVLLNVRELSVQKVSSLPKGHEWSGSGLAYLGYGVTKSTGPNGCTPVRECFAPGSTFQLDLTFHPQADPKDIQWVLRSLWAFWHFGGAGSRSRRGYGSIGLEHLDVTGLRVPDIFAADSVRTPVELARLLRGLISAWRNQSTSDTGTDTANGGQNGGQDDEIPYTRFCQGTKIVVAQPKNSWEQALAYVGAEMLNFRSFKRQRNFPDDHDLIADFLTKGKADKAPRRVVFGLPHNYFFTSLPKDSRKASVNVAGGGGESSGRRASPLFIHIHPLKNDKVTQYVPVLTFLPCEFLPAGARISISGEVRGRNTEVKVPVSANDYAPIEDFLRRLTHQGAVEVTLP